MGYWKIAITPEHYELRDDSGHTVATVKGLTHARLFARSWDYRQKLEEIREQLKGSNPEIADSISKVLREKTPESKETRG